MKVCCAGAAVLAVTAVTADLAAPKRITSSFLSLQPNQNSRLTYNQLIGENGNKQTPVYGRAHIFRRDNIEGNVESSGDTQTKTENESYGFSDLYETLRADVNGVSPAWAILDHLPDELPEAASSSLAAFNQLHALSPPGSNQKKSDGVERQTSGATSVLRALTRPFVAVGSAALRATRELRRYLSSPKLSCLLDVEDKKIGGSGSPIVAKAVGRLGSGRVTGFLRKVDEELELYLPRNQEVGYDCVDVRQRIVLRRGFPLGSGTFGFVVPFTSIRGAKYAGKLFQVRYGEQRTMNTVRKQLSILNYLPPGMDAATASHTLRLGLPLCVITKRSSPTIMELPTRGKLLNAIVLYPLLRGDLSYLTASLKYTRPEDRDVLLNLTQQVVRAVSDVHKLSLVHFDIKLPNFLVTARGSVLTGDLDGVKPFGSPVLPVMFTAAFAAPEVAGIVLKQDKTAVAEPTMDSWPLGISIYGIWCGGYPFSNDFRLLGADEQMEILHTVPSQTLVYDVECIESMPKEVSNLITQLLRPDPKDRLTPRQALASHPAMMLQVPGGEDVRSTEQEEMPSKTSEEEAAPLSTASTASTEEAGRPPSLSSSYVFVRPDMVPRGQSFQQKDAKTSSSNGYRFVGSYVREPEPVKHNYQQQQLPGSL